MPERARDESSPAKQLAEVIVDVPTLQTDQPYHYLIPEQLTGKVLPGSRVVVPFGSRHVEGFVMALKQEPAGEVATTMRNKVLKEIRALLDEKPILTEELLALAEWMSQRYICFRSTAIKAMLPTVFKANRALQGEPTSAHLSGNLPRPKLRLYVELRIAGEEFNHVLAGLPPQAKKQRAVLKHLHHFGRRMPLTELVQACQTSRSTIKSLEEKGFVQILSEEVERDPFADVHFPTTEPLPLTPSQNEVYQRISEAVEREQQQTFLLHGVTGSGKTEIYLQIIAQVLAKEKGAIVLVPEISLTPQMMARFRGRFGQQVVVLHSRLSAGERYDAWKKIKEGRSKVVIGARSALFAPVMDLGVVIIDEEHETAYKQEESPKYHAREVALFRAQFHQAVVILGSATPSLESYARSRKNLYTLLSLKQRVQGQALPKVHVVDMREELAAGNRSLFSRMLYRKIEERLTRGEQMVLFLNRRGFATFVMCRDCGFVLQCPHCEISLTYHKVNNSCRCHYCGYAETRPSQCPKCESHHIRFFGTGTQKVEEALSQAFPGIRIIRMDVDTTRKKGAHQRLLEAFAQQRADCLLGTQMIAKGLDFDNVTLVGVIAADAMLHLPDFRAAERTFQLLTQVSGRAGRRDKPGEVVIQTYTPNHYSILCASRHDYHSFYQQEMRYRYQQGYPPYYYLSVLLFAHEDLTFCIQSAEQAADWLKSRLPEESLILGPVAAPILRIKDRYRYQCMIKYKNESNLRQVLRELMQQMQPRVIKHGLQFQIDMEPQVIL